MFTITIISLLLLLLSLQFIIEQGERNRWPRHKSNLDRGCSQKTGTARRGRISPHIFFFNVKCVFGVFLTLDYDYMCSETDFTQEKKSYSSNYKNHHSSLPLAAALSQNGRIAV